MNLLIDYKNNARTNNSAYREHIINDIIEIHKGNFSGDVIRGIGMDRFYHSGITQERLRSIVYNQINPFVISLQEVSITDDNNINIIYD